jgi:hypothetical protein
VGNSEGTWRGGLKTKVEGIESKEDGEINEEEEE